MQRISYQRNTSTGKPTVSYFKVKRYTLQGTKSLSKACEIK